MRKSFARFGRFIGGLPKRAFSRIRKALKSVERRVRPVLKRILPSRALPGNADKRNVAFVLREVQQSVVDLREFQSESDRMLLALLKSQQMQEASSGVLPDGSEMDGIKELLKELLQNQRETNAKLAKLTACGQGVAQNTAVLQVGPDSNAEQRIFGWDSSEPKREAG